MEFSIYSLVIPTILFIILANYLFKSKPDAQLQNLPPGSFGWPFIGETYEFLYTKPEVFVGKRMNKYSPKIFKTMIFGEPTAILCGPAGHKFIGANEEKIFRGWRFYSMQKLFRSTYQKTAAASIKRQAETHILGAPGFLKTEALVGYIGKMDSIVENHIQQHWLGKKHVKALDLVQLMTTSILTNFYYGNQDYDRTSKLVRLLDGISLGLHSIPVNFPGTVFHRAKKSADAIREELLEVIKEKKIAISNGVAMRDIMTFMIAKTDSSGRLMPDHEIADKIMGLLLAGFTTPTTALAFVMKFIGERPQVFEKIRAEQQEIRRSKESGETLKWQDLHKMSYTWNVALEVMRVVPPFPGTFRDVITDFTYEGYTIPKGWKVYWAIASTNKNPAYFEEAEEFKDGRFGQENYPPPYTNIPFGGGPRICPGKEYARLVFLTFIYNIVESLRWEVIVPDEKIIEGMIPILAQRLPLRLHTL